MTHSQLVNKWAPWKVTPVFIRANCRISQITLPFPERVAEQLTVRNAAATRMEVFEQLGAAQRCSCPSYASYATRKDGVCSEIRRRQISLFCTSFILGYVSHEHWFSYERGIDGDCFGWFNQATFVLGSQCKTLSQASVSYEIGIDGGNFCQIGRCLSAISPQQAKSLFCSGLPRVFTKSLLGTCQGPKSCLRNQRIVFTFVV